MRRLFAAMVSACLLLVLALLAPWTMSGAGAITQPTPVSAICAADTGCVIVSSAAPYTQLRVNVSCGRIASSFSVGARVFFADRSSVTTPPWQVACVPGARLTRTASITGSTSAVGYWAINGSRVGPYAATGAGLGSSSPDNDGSGFHWDDIRG